MSTLEATTLAVAAVVVLVALIAVVLAWRTTGRGRAGVAVQPEPDVPPGAASVLEALRSSALLVGTDDVVRTASAQVYSMGLVSGGRLVPSQLVEMVAGVRRDGQIREAELVLPHVRSQSRYVLARVAPLSPRIVLVLLEDRTHERHVEMVRRDFVANVSHELKTPVGALRLLAEAVKEAADDPEAVVRFAGRMQHESVRLDRLVQQIIELSRLQGDERVEEPVVVEVADVISVAVQGSRTAAEAKAMSLRMHVDPGLEVLGDPDQLEAAIGNLVENAVTYGREASRVAVVARTVGEQVQIAVSDQGVGIAQSELERIFERFYRVDPARARATGGTGLGLSIVKHVAASHGGDITVWSEPGQGSTFTLCLPAYRGHGRGSGSSGGRGADATAEPARDELDPPASRAALRGEPRVRLVRRPGRSDHDEGGRTVTRVLVVEDEESYSDAVAYVLRREGYEVAIAGDGREALAEFERAGADIVLLDLMLPGLPGTEVCRRLRQVSNVPVIVVSAKDSEVDKVVGLELGADDYVTKPYSPRELVARIRAVLRRGQDVDLAPTTLESGRVRMDVDRHLVSVEGEQVRLPLKEFELLEMFLRNTGRVLTRGQLIDRVWGSDYVGDTKTLDVHVKRLRAKIEPDPAVPQHLVTVRGLGYRYDG